MKLCKINMQHNHLHHPTIVGTGLVALDVLLTDDCANAETALGGSAGNVLAILGHLGWSSTPVAQLGMDEAAARIKFEFRKLGANTQFLLQSEQMSTPVVYQYPAKTGHSHEFSFRCPYCGLKRGFVPPIDDGTLIPNLRVIATPDVFYFDRVTPWALELAERYREMGALVMFEPSTIGSDLEAFRRGIRAAHIVKYADDRIADIERVDLSSVEVEIQTHGKRGLQFRLADHPTTWHNLSAFDIPYVADTAGAGDWCTSGFLYALVGSIFEHHSNPRLSTRRIRESLRFGQILAALNCMEKGARGLARRHPSERLIELATSIRAGMHHRFNPSIEGGDDKAGGLHSASPSKSLDALFTALCCEPLTH
jgi:fructokinase